MDFRTCPACKASVLEDDVADCPFCGASMSGKPSVAPQSAKTAVQSQPKPSAVPAKQPATRSGGAPSRASDGAAAARRPAPRATDAEPPAGDDGDPFDLDTRAALNAVPVSPKPAQGRTYRVVCPMCETQGFISIKHAGKDVKCCNPQCLVPVFTAPRPARPEKEQEPEARRGLSMTALSIGSTVLLLGAAAAIYVFVINRPEPKPTVPQFTTTEPVQATTTTAPETRTETPRTTGLPPVPLDEVRETSLTELVKAAQQRDGNRSKPFGRSLAAEAYARVGRFKEAREQLEQLRELKGTIPFFQVAPLVAIAMEQWKTGDRAAAGQTLDEALAVAEFPSEGRPGFDSAGLLAAALVVAGRGDDARRVAGANSDPSPRGHVSALWRGAIDLQTFDVDASADRPYLQDMPHPQWVAVTRTVAGWSGSDAALAWARSSTNPAARDNSLAAWAGTLVRTAPTPTDSGALAQVESVAGEATPAGKARLWSAVADVQIGKGDRDAASASLQKAVEALASLEVPAPLAVPGMKAIYDSLGQARAGLPDASAWRAGALAAMDVAQLHAELGQRAEAWSAVQKALGFTRAMTPSPAATRTLLEACEKNRAAVERELQQTVDVDVFRAFNQYRQQCRILNDEAQQRLGFQEDLLRRAVRMGLTEQVWQEISSREQQADGSQREPWNETTLPGLIVASARGAGRSDLADAVARALAPARVGAGTLDRVELEVPALAAAGEFGKAAALLGDHYRRSHGNRYPADLVALRSVSRLLKEGQHEAAFQFAAALPDALAKEDAFWLVAAAATRDGKHSEIWRKIPHQKFSATERATLYRGFIDGLALAKASEPAAASATAERK
jgi:tetratricopeptide (TPR) repeat protein